MAAAEEARPLNGGEAKGEATGTLARCLSACCCLDLKARDEATELVTKSTSAQPSLYQRLCMCQCAPQDRLPSGLELVPQLQGLAGVLLQDGDHETGGTLFTLKWASFDREKRTMEIPVFGGFYGGSTTGVWTQPLEVRWCCLMNLGRTGNYTYRLEFNEDFSFADIRVFGNPLVLCCCCFPCIPAWFEMPRCIASPTMRQSEGSSDGTSWDRFEARFGGEPEFYYRLLQVLDDKGQRGPHYDRISTAPRQMVVTF